MLLNIKNIEAFQILERPAVKQDQDGHHLAPGHREFPVPFLDFRVRQRVLSDHVIKFFEKLVDNEINFCNFMVWNHSGIISVLFSFQRFKTTNFFAIFLLFIHFSYIELTLFKIPSSKEGILRLFLFHFVIISDHYFYNYIAIIDYQRKKLFSTSASVKGIFSGFL